MRLCWSWIRYRYRPRHRPINPNPELRSQCVAIRSVLQRNQEAEDQASARIRELEADIRRHRYPPHWADHHWVTQMHDWTFLEAAHSMAAIGLIAPLIESLFSQTVTYFKDAQIWKESRRRVGIAKAFLQIAENIDLRRHMPDDLIRRRQLSLRIGTRCFTLASSGRTGTLPISPSASIQMVGQAISHALNQVTTLGSST